MGPGYSYPKDCIHLERHPLRTRTVTPLPNMSATYLLYLYIPVNEGTVGLSTRRLHVSEAGEPI